MASSNQRSRNWRTDRIAVQGKNFFLGDVKGGKLYHGSPAKLRVGTILKPASVTGLDTRFLQSDPDNVSVTSDLDRAVYWAEHGAASGHVFVYEVEPLDYVDPWRVGLEDYGKSFVLWEGMTPAARIVRVHKI